MAKWRRNPDEEGYGNHPPYDQERESVPFDESFRAQCEKYRDLAAKHKVPVEPLVRLVARLEDLREEAWAVHVDLEKGVVQLLGHDEQAWDLARSEIRKVTKALHRAEKVLRRADDRNRWTRTLTDVLAQAGEGRLAELVQPLHELREIFERAAALEGTHTAEGVQAWHKDVAVDCQAFWRKHRQGESDRANFMKAKGSGNFGQGRETRAPNNRFSKFFCDLTKRLFRWAPGRAATVLERARGTER